MNRFTTLLARSFATVLSLALVNISIPMGGMTHLAPDPSAPKPAPEPEKPKPIASRALTSKESKSLQGRLAEDPYRAGQNKWDVVHKGVNLMTGNLTASGTDLTFEGGYGIPINVTRSYSANNPDEGPLGKGWTLSVDIRNTAGGLLKSGSAPVRSVPVNFKERPAGQDDPQILDANEPVEAVIATDAGGKEETIQKDADGILTTPSWDKNRNVSEYETVTVGTALYQILKRNIVTTPEGTVYVYEKQGSYDSPGMVNIDNPSATTTPCNILKPVSVTDRHGNVTTYTYGSTTVSFSKANGAVTEKRLESIEMPNGHEIEFTWGNGTNAPTNRIRTASDGIRTVTYGYTSGLLTSVTTPAGKETSYQYNSATLYSGSTLSVAQNILTKITDPRGLETSFVHMMFNSGSVSVPRPFVYCTKVTEPNGVYTNFKPYGMIDPTWGGPYLSGPPTWETYDASNQHLYAGRIDTSVNQSAGTMTFSTWGALGAPFPFYSKTYDALNQNLLEQNDYSQDDHPGNTVFDLRYARRTNVGAQNLKQVRSVNVYNFMGNPLKKTIYENRWTGVTISSSVEKTVQYAYWDRTKYYQQKIVKDQAGRYSFTDYFDWNAAQGKKGQTYRVYDGKRSTWGTDSGAYIPSSTPVGDQWKYNLVPANANTFSAEFDYDLKGRPTDVWKIQKTTTNPWTYVQTKTTYGSDGSPAWGAATQVVEDYGSGKINRTTNTLAYDSIGRAIEVQDASGKQFETTYDLDGVVQSVYRTDSSLNQMIVGYSYGTTGLLNGMVTQVVDGLSGVTQDFSYETIGGGKGQVASVTETNGTDTYSTSYSYNSAGERHTATYTTPNGVNSYRYSDYRIVGDPHNGQRVFQTLNKLDSGGNATAEEFHYTYDSSGRLSSATFAQTPQVGGSAPTSAPFYTQSYPADTRARAYYTYDPAGRVEKVEHSWDVWNGSGYDATKIVKNESSYEQSGLKRGLKTANSFYVNNSGSWALDRTEYYGYDADLDYLTSANYNDGLPNASPTWSYDAAGNRNDATVVDNLNRATTIGGVSRTYDILGNTLTKGSGTGYEWDALNRMTTFATSSVGNAMKYRADGMRVSKHGGRRFNGSNFSQLTGGSHPYSRFYYDGQMPIETEDGDYDVALLTETPSAVTRNTLGARGIDRIERVNSSGTTIGYPLYDGHGNMVATLAKSGSGFNVNDQRSYDAWGIIRSGNTTGDPKGRYVAKIGHVDDDESGLTYMRARYYEAHSGRFVSQDPAMDHWNWFVYCYNNPTNLVDPNGKLGVGDSSDINSLILQVLRAFGFQGTTPKLLDIVLAYVEKISLCLSIELVGDNLLAIGMLGMGGAGVFTQGPWAAGVAGVAALGGMMISIFAKLAAIIVTRDLIVELWLYSAETGE